MKFFVGLSDFIIHISDLLDFQEGLTPLHCAAKSGHEQEVNLLLNTGAPISAKTANGLSPFHMAIQGDHENCASVMLSHNAPVNDKTKVGSISLQFLITLYVSIIFQDEEMVEMASH